MAKVDWTLLFSGEQSVVDFEGSKRCRFDGTQSMLYNGRNNLADCEVISDIRFSSIGNYAILALRLDLTGANGYFVLIDGWRHYFLLRKVNGVWTSLNVVTVADSWDSFLTTRFRVEGFELSLSVWKDEQWIDVFNVIDNLSSHVSGYAGIGGQNSGTNYCLHDNVIISEKN